MPSPQPGERPPIGSITERDQRRARDDGGRQLVEHRSRLRRDTALAPQPAQLAVRLQRRRPRPALQARLQMLHGAGDQRGGANAAEQLHGARDDGRRRSCEHTGANEHEQQRQQPQQVDQVGAQAAGLQTPHDRGAAQRAALSPARR